MTRRAVTIIVLAWNRWDLTERCLSTLLESDLEEAEILVVDNGSTDETPKQLAKLADESKIRVLTLPENLGFVRGNNAGIEATESNRDILLLNNDIEVHQADWLDRIRDCASTSERIGVVGCRLVDEHGQLLHAGTYIPPETMWGQQIGAGEKNIGQYGSTRIVEGIVFACAYIKREVLDAIGGLALDFESYFEDTDYCLRAADAGFDTVLCGSATLTHREHGSTSSDPEARLKIFQESRKIFRKKWQKTLESRYEQDLLWQSIMNFPTGYARASREFLLALDQLGVRSTYRYVYGPRTVFPKEEPEGFDDTRLNVFAGRTPRKRDVSVVFGQGDVFYRNKGKYKIGYTMLEVDGFPEEWVRQANEMDEVWVPSQANLEAYVSSGLEKPAHIIPLGVNTDYFHPGIRRVRNPDDDFVFLSVFEWGERKAPELLLQAFNEVFSAKDPVQLVCKVINVDPGVSLKNEITKLGLRSNGGRISYLLNMEFPHYQLAMLYRSADCFVTTSRGEGWNLPLMEAMACGLPCVATDWGPHQEFINEEVAYPLAVRGTIPAIAKCPYYDGYSWADPDPEHLRVLLREIFDNRDQAAAIGQAAARSVAEKWTWEAASAKIEERLSAL